MAVSTANVVASIETSSAAYSVSNPAPPLYSTPHRARHQEDLDARTLSTPHCNRKYSGMDTSESLNTIVTTHTDLLQTTSTSSTKQSSITIVPAQQQSPRFPHHSGAASNLNTSSPDPNKPLRKRSTVVTLYRFVEQEESEPFTMVLFKWTLIIIGLGMLGVVLYFMLEVVWVWFSGEEIPIVELTNAQNSTMANNSTVSE